MRTSGEFCEGRVIYPETYRNRKGKRVDALNGGGGWKTEGSRSKTLQGETGRKKIHSLSVWIHEAPAMRVMQ